MHELSIALGIVDLATEEMQRHPGARARAVHLQLGALSGVVKDALLSAYELACEESPLEGARLVIEEVPVEILCPRCGKSQPVMDIQNMRCRICHTASAEVVKGRELEIVAIEIDSNSPGDTN